MAQPLIILGTGGNCFDILDAVAALNGQRPTFEVLGFLDDDVRKQGQVFCGVPVLGPLSSARQYGDAQFVNGIGSPVSYLQKPACIASTGLALEQFATIVHPAAAVSTFAALEQGTVVLANATVCAGASVGPHCMILPHCVISHDCRVNAYAILASSAVLCGNVVVEPSCYIGASSVVRGGLTIGTRSLVGAGSVVLQDVPAHTVVAGNPAKTLRNV